MKHLYNVHLGCLLFLNGKIVTVKRLSLNKNRINGIPAKHFKGIPITKERLLDIGVIEHRTYFLAGVIRIIFDKCSIETGWITIQIGNITTARRYIHEIQSLIYSLAQ